MKGIRDDYDVFLIITFTTTENRENVLISAESVIGYSAPEVSV
jgi:hypothetical protein